ncbi:MAG TPA: hypothetical protein VLG49_06085 [Rhabdochlamydiaceae bacterium]|nr:hypothetical protein [Rhabdochlamydiaceae bacterium]
MSQITPVGGPQWTTYRVEDMPEAVQDTVIEENSPMNTTSSAQSLLERIPPILEANGLAEQSYPSLEEDPDSEAEFEDMPELERVPDRIA